MVDAATSRCGGRASAGAARPALRRKWRRRRGRPGRARDVAKEVSSPVEPLDPRIVNARSAPGHEIPYEDAVTPMSGGDASAARADPGRASRAAVPHHEPAGAGRVGGPAALRVGDDGDEATVPRDGRVAAPARRRSARARDADLRRRPPAPVAQVDVPVDVRLSTLPPGRGWSSGEKFGAQEQNATKRPSSEIDGSMLAPLPH